MKYEDWIRYEQQRERQPEIFAWVRLPEQPPEPEIKISRTISTQGRQKNDSRFAQILRSLHL